MGACTNENEQQQNIDIYYNYDVTFNKSKLLVEVHILNLIEGTDTYKWSFPGGTPSSSTSANPGPIVYTEQGVYEIFLDAGIKTSLVSYSLEINLYEDIVVDFDFVRDHHVISDRFNLQINVLELHHMIGNFRMVCQIIPMNLNLRMYDITEAEGTTLL